MSIWNGNIAILATLWWTLQVHCDPTISTTSYFFPRRHMITGKNHIRDTNLVYGLCSYGKDNQTAACRIIYDGDAFGDSSPLYFCDVSLSIEAANQTIDVLELHLWDAQKAIFIWRYIDSENVWQSVVKIQIVYLAKCDVVEYSLVVDNRRDKKSEVFITSYVDYFHVVYASTSQCVDHYCRITIYADGFMSTPEQWFPNNELIYTMKSVDSNSNVVLVTVQSNGWAKYTMLNENNRKKTDMGGAISFYDLGFATENNYISLCSIQRCLIYNSNGEKERDVGFVMSSLPSKYAAVYNLPNRKQLAMMCDSRGRSSYRVIKIGHNGKQEYSFNLAEFKCSRDPNYMTPKFFQKSETEYCLSIFYSTYTHPGKFHFSTYCFDDMMEVD